MPLALWTLLFLNARAGLRRLTRRSRTGKGLVLVAAVLVVYGAKTVFLNGRLPRTDPAAVRLFGPLTVLGLCLLNLVTSAGERAVTFGPAEVDFLFPGPFTRRQLLAYKLIKTGLFAVPSALLFGVVAGRYGGAFLGRAIAVWLIFQFVQLVAMVSALVQSTVGEYAFTRTRRWVVAGVLALAAAALTPSVWRERTARPVELAAHLQASPVGRVLLAPFGVFPRALTAPRLFPNGLAWDALGAAMIAGLVAVVFLLDANYLETAAVASGKRHARVARMRAAGLAGTASQKSANLRLPMLPWLGGAGPVAWRQLTTVARTSRGLLVILAVVAVAAGGAVSGAGRSPEALGRLIGLSVWVNLFLTSLLKFDFRGDLDQIDNLRALPLHPAAVAAAEVVAPTLILSAVQWLLLLAIAVFGHLPGRGLVAAAAVVLPVNALLVASENLLFLLFPFRPPAAVAGDMGMVGRQTVVFLARLLMLAAVLAVAGLVGYAAYLIAGLALAVAAAAAAVAAALAGVIALMAVVLARFDPSVDTPA